MAVITRAPRFEQRPVQAARARRRKFPWYFEMDSATLFMAGVTLLSLTCLLYLLQTSRVAVLGYEIQQAQIERARETRRADELRYAISRRESLPAVEKYARTKLGMRPVQRYEYIKARISPTDLQPRRAASPQTPVREAR